MCTLPERRVRSKISDHHLLVVPSKGNERSFLPKFHNEYPCIIRNIRKDNMCGTIWRVYMMLLSYSTTDCIPVSSRRKFIAVGCITGIYVSPKGDEGQYEG